MTTTLPSPLATRCMAVVSAMFAVIAGAATHETPDGSGSSVELRPGVVVDPGRGAVYLMNREGGLDSIDLASGSLLWRTDRAAKPLLRHGDRLVAQTETPLQRQLLRLILLNPRDVAAEPRFVDVPLPAGVEASIDDGMESTFSATARVHEGTPVLRWEYTFRPATGAPPGPDDQALERRESGILRIDLHTGQIEPIDRMPAEDETDLPTAMRKDARALPGRVWRVDDRWVAIERSTHEGRQRVTLRRWDAETGEALTDVTLFEGGPSFRSISADRRHLLASQRDASESAMWEWAIYSVETGARIARLRHAEPGARFLVSGNRLIHETQATERRVGDQVVVEPAKLRAIDLETGAEAWSHPTRDTRHRGAYPPDTGR